MKKVSWEDDVVVRVTRDARAKLKLKAIKVGLTLKDYLTKLANEKV